MLTRFIKDNIQLHNNLLYNNLNRTDSYLPLVLSGVSHGGYLCLSLFVIFVMSLNNCQSFF